MYCPSFTVLNYSAYDSTFKRVRKGERIAYAYEFELYATDCTGGIAINGTRYYAKKGCFSLTKPGERIEMIPPYKCYFFNIYTQDETLVEVLSELPSFGVLWNMDEAMKIFREMLSLDATATTESLLQLQSCVSRLLSIIVRSRPLALEKVAENALTHRKMLQQVDRYIREHYMEDLTLALLAEQCNLHPNYFHKLYTDAFGQTPAQRILNCRIAMAKVLLLTESYSMSEIAAHCGFSSQTYFGYKFKGILHMTPLQYRKKMLGSRK